MRQLFQLIRWTSLMFLVAAATNAPLRAVPVTEDTPSPSTSTSIYPTCSSLDLSDFKALIYTEANDCALKATYMWAGTSLPTTTERQELCMCTKLITKIQKVTIPRCSVVRDDRNISYADLVEYAFGLCSPSGGTVPPTPTISANAPTPTTTSPTIPTPTSSPKKKDKAVGNPTAAGTASNANTNTDLIVVIVVVSVVVVAIAAFIAFKCGQRRRAMKTQAEELPVDGGDVILSPHGPYDSLSSSTRPLLNPKAHLTPKTTGSSTGGHGTATRPTDMAMWDDPVLLAMRVPYDSVFFGPRLSRGGFGEVYQGTYRGETVAIKQLLPERRKDLAQINGFLREAQLMTSLEHERIVRLIGVAWNALSDVCVIIEFMEKGDLRSVLTKWDTEEKRSQGFDSDKLKIALHVAHALTYLHSLQPMIVHRDLKSKNILLNDQYDAKLTDFGVSRERSDSTMTAAIGSSLWMAPEVLLGERYNEKADIFSFGIVLSELNSQKLPYAHVTEANSETKLPDSAILQLVSLGRLQISFTPTTPLELVQLGLDCVQLDATKRPTSAEVLHRVHQVMRQRN